MSLEHITRSADCVVRNCKIGILIRCSAREIRDATQFGKETVMRTATRLQENSREETGCDNCAYEEVKIIYDESGNAIKYDLPEVPADTQLEFTIVAGFVPYGTNLAHLLIATHDEPIPNSECSTLIEAYNTQLSEAYLGDRMFFPPQKIFIDGKPYEVGAIAICNHHPCIYNNGKIEISPFPFIPPKQTP